jgi:hypothetical protein
MEQPMRVWDYPKETVVIACDECGRRGRYSKARFVELVGGNTHLANALEQIAADCPRQVASLKMTIGRCKAYFADF